MCKVTTVLFFGISHTQIPCFIRKPQTNTCLQRPHTRLISDQYFHFLLHNAENSIVGLYPFSKKTTRNDKSGFGNHASFYGIQYENGPLGDAAGSVRMRGSSSSYIRVTNIFCKTNIKMCCVMLCYVTLPYLFTISLHSPM